MWFYVAATCFTLALLPEVARAFHRIARAYRRRRIMARAAWGTR